MSTSTRLWVVVLLLLVGAMVFLLQWRGPAHKQYLLRCNPHAVADITLTNSFGTFLFENVNEEWYLKGPERRRAFHKAVGFLIAHLVTIEPRRVVDPPWGNPVDFGLQPPRIAVRLTTADGKACGLQIGTVNPLGEAVYAQVDGDPHLYLLANILPRYLDQGPLEWVSRRWIHPPPLEALTALRVSLLSNQWAFVHGPTGWVVKDDEGEQPLAEAKMTAIWQAMQGVNMHKLIGRADAEGVVQGFQYDPDLQLTLEGEDATQRYEFWFTGPKVFGQSPLAPKHVVKFHAVSLVPLLQLFSEIRHIPPLKWWSEGDPAVADREGSLWNQVREGFHLP